MNAQNYSLQFDGINDYIQVSPMPSLNFGTNDFTLEALTNVDTTAGNHYRAIITNQDTNFNAGFFFGLDTLGRLLLRVNGVNYFATNSGGKSIQFGGCHHVAVVRTAVKIDFYIDGLNAATYAVTAGNINNGLVGYIGATPLQPTLKAYKGTLDDIRIWSVARSGGDIQLKSTECLIGNETGLVANWRFDQPQIKAALDFSPNKYNIAFTLMLDNQPGWINASCLSHTSCWFWESNKLASTTCIQDTKTYRCGEINMICNGDFEQGQSPALIAPVVNFQLCDGLGNSQDVINWCDFNSNSTSDLFIKDPATPSSNRIPNITYCGPWFCNWPSGIDTWDSPNPNNKRYAGFQWNSSPITCNNEGVVTNLVTPVVANQTYKLTMMAHTSCILQSAGLTAYLSENAFSGSTFTIGTEFIPNDGNWHKVEFIFTYTGTLNMENLIITNVGCQITPAGNTPGFFLIDDVTLYNFLPDYILATATGVGSHRPEKVVADIDGNTYATGYVYDPADFDGNGIANDMFLVSYDPCGTFRWLTTLNDLWAIDMVTDNHGNLYVVGKTLTTNQAFLAGFDMLTGSLLPTTGTLTTNPLYISTAEEASAIAIDNGWPSAHLFVAVNQMSLGRYKIFEYNANSVAPTTGYNPANNPKQYCYGLTISNGTVYSTGTSWLSGTNSAFISNFLPNGNLNITLDAASGYNNICAYGITADGGGNIIITGCFSDAYINFKTAGTQTNGGGLANTYDIFIASALPNLSDFNWGYSIGDANDDYGYDVIANVNDIYFTGSFNGTAHFGTSISLNSGSSSVLFDAKINSGGVFNWANFAPSGPSPLGGFGSTGTSLVYDDGYIYTIGYVNGWVNVDGLFFQPPTGFCDNFFMARLHDYGSTAIYEKQIKSNLTHFDFTVTPNPNTGSFAINLPQAIKETATLKIYDNLGRCVFTKEVQKQKADKIEIATALKSGIYCIVIKNNTTAHTGKMIIR